MSDVVAAIRAAIDETEAWALAASQTQAPGTPTGEHWQWECSHCDTVITINPVTDSTVECPDQCGAQVSLRSVEQYPTSSSYTLPAFIVSSAEEVPATAGALIIRHDPAGVLRRCAADRKILDAHGREHDCIELTGSGDASLVDGQPWELWEATDRDEQRPCFVVRSLAEAYGVEP